MKSAIEPKSFLEQGIPELTEAFYLDRLSSMAVYGGDLNITVTERSKSPEREPVAGLLSKLPPRVLKISVTSPTHTSWVWEGSVERWRNATMYHAKQLSKRDATRELRATPATPATPTSEED